MKRFLAGSLFLLLSLVPGLRGAETIGASWLDAYYKISEALAADSLSGVAENAQVACGDDQGSCAAAGRA